MVDMENLEEQRPDVALSCAIGMLRMSTHEPWLSGEHLVMHLSQTQSGRWPTLVLMAPQEDPAKSLAEYILQDDCTKLTFKAEDDHQNIGSAVIRLKALSSGDCKRTIDALAHLSFVAAEEARRDTKTTENEPLSAILQILPMIGTINVTRIQRND